MPALLSRPEFGLSPRPLPPAKTLDRAYSELGQALACLRRSAAAPRLYIRANPRCWRWLFIPPAPPFRGEG